MCFSFNLERALVRWHFYGAATWIRDLKKAICDRVTADKNEKAAEKLGTLFECSRYYLLEYCHLEQRLERILKNAGKSKGLTEEETEKARTLVDQKNRAYRLYCGYM